MTSAHKTTTRHPTCERLDAGMCVCVCVCVCVRHLDLCTLFYGMHVPFSGVSNTRVNTVTAPHISFPRIAESAHCSRGLRNTRATRHKRNVWRLSSTSTRPNSTRHAFPKLLTQQKQSIWTVVPFHALGFRFSPPMAHAWLNSMHVSRDFGN